MYLVIRKFIIAFCSVVFCTSFLLLTIMCGNPADEIRRNPTKDRCVISPPNSKKILYCIDNDIQFEYESKVATSYFKRVFPTPGYRCVCNEDDRRYLQLEDVNITELLK
jgi:hypothetical protein